MTPNKPSDNSIAKKSDEGKRDKIYIHTLDSDAVQSKKKKITSPCMPESEKNKEKTVTEVKLSIDVPGIDSIAWANHLQRIQVL